MPDQKSAVYPCESKMLPGIHAPASASIVRVFSFLSARVELSTKMRGGYVHSLSGAGIYIISSIWAIPTRHIDIGKAA